MKYIDQIDIVEGVRQMRWFWLFYAFLLLLMLTLGGCATMVSPASSGGECRVFHDPGFAVRGKRLKDAQWIGKTQEVGIVVCGWKRPRN